MTVSHKVPSVTRVPGAAHPAVTVTPVVTPPLRYGFIMLDHDRQHDVADPRHVPVAGALPEWGAVKTFDELFAELSAKAATRTPGSGTVAALADGLHAAGKKVVEEAAEAWMAAEHEGPERAAEEIAQLLYRTQVLMLATGLDLKDVYRHL